MPVTKSVGEVNECVDDLLWSIDKKQAVIPVVKECEHLVLGICALFFRKILILLIVFNKGKKIRDLKHFGSSAVRELAVFDPVSYRRQLDHDGDDHVLIILRKRRNGEIVHHIRIGSQKLIKAEITVEVGRDGIPPVVCKILE